MIGLNDNLIRFYKLNDVKDKLNNNKRFKIDYKNKLNYDDDLESILNDLLNDDISDISSIDNIYKNPSDKTLIDPIRFPNELANIHNDTDYNRSWEIINYYCLPDCFLTYQFSNGFHSSFIGSKYILNFFIELKKSVPDGISLLGNITSSSDETYDILYCKMRCTGTVVNTEPLQKFFGFKEKFDYTELINESVLSKEKLLYLQSQKQKLMNGRYYIQVFLKIYLKLYVDRDTNKVKWYNDSVKLSSYKAVAM